jgi:hypothetical protein
MAKTLMPAFGAQQRCLLSTSTDGSEIQFTLSQLARLPCLKKHQSAPTSRLLSHPNRIAKPFRSLAHRKKSR